MTNPIAWLHDDPERFDVIHVAAKALWLQVWPQQVEHYTIPLVRADEIDALRARVAQLEAQIGPLRVLVAACNRLDAEAEEYDFDDGMGRGAALDYWHEFDQAIEAARAALEPKL